MQNYNQRMDFRCSDSKVTQRQSSDFLTIQDSAVWQLRRNFDIQQSSERSLKRFSSGSTRVQRRLTNSKCEDDGLSQQQTISSNCMLRNKNHIRDNLRRGSPGKDPAMIHRLRSTFTNNSIMSGEWPSSNVHYKPLGVKPHCNLRMSYDYQRSNELTIERSRELSSIEQTLDSLSTKVFNAKKELVKKNDKHKQHKYGQPQYSFEEQEDELFHKQQEESEISKEESVNTVVKTNYPSSRKLPSKISSLVQSIPKPKEVRGFQYNPYSPRRHSQYYISELVRAASDSNSVAMEHLSSSMHFLKVLEEEEIPSYADIEGRKLNLKKKDYYKDRKTLVFDLDQTLIHCNDNPESPSDIILTIRIDDEQSQVCINIRPYAITLLNELSRSFELIVFTASHKSYADVVLDYLDPEHKLIQHRLYREHCYFTSNQIYVKDLRIINRGMHQMVLIDNAAYSYAFQLENAIPIFPYYDGSNDFELKALETYLAKIATVRDVRELNKKTFQLHQYLNYNTPEELVEGLYTAN